MADTPENPNKSAPPPPPNSGRQSDGESDVQAILQGLNRKFQEKETQRRAGDLSLPYMDLVGFPIDQTILGLTTKEQSLVAQAIPFANEGRELKIGLVAPDNPNLSAYLANFEKKKYQMELYMISQSSLFAALEQFKKIIPIPLRTQKDLLVTASQESFGKLKGLQNLGAEAVHLPATEIINLVIGSAVFLDASDIHLEPEKSVLKVRFRVDGVLQDIVSLPDQLTHLLLSRIKLLSGLKLNVSSAPQDGRFTAQLPEKSLDLRVSTLPSAFGESIVMRLLGIQDLRLKIDRLGFRDSVLKLVYKELAKPNGLILTTGPTGSGKTTTLYSFLSHLNEPGVKIITIEDPVEYRLEGIVQTPIDRTAGMDFAQALRSILRQDPNIIMVGEIRDFETAETVCQAALTGHMVFSTLHTNDAAGAIPRFLDLGVKPVTLAPAVNLIIAQRLLRKICQHCRQVYKPSFEELNHVKAILTQIPKGAVDKVPEQTVFYHSPGCDLCNHLGYSGRIGVFEAFSKDETISKLIFNQASTVDIKKAAVAQGMLSMQEDAILKALEGLTDLAEVWRVTEE